MHPPNYSILVMTMTTTVTTTTAAAATTTTTTCISNITNTTHALVGRSKLEYLSNGAEVASLVVSQTLDNADINYVKGIRSNDG